MAHGTGRRSDAGWCPRFHLQEPSVAFVLSDSAYTRGMWDHKFEFRFTVTLGAGELRTTLTARNTGDTPFQVTGALHSYWAVSALKNVEVSGPFKGASYLDKTVSPPVRRTGDANDLTIPATQATESVYDDVWGDLSMADRGDGSELRIQASGWTDTVVWNPCKEGMGSAKFLCVESAKVTPVAVPAGAEWVATMSIQPGKL